MVTGNILMLTVNNSASICNTHIHLGVVLEMIATYLYTHHRPPSLLICSSTFYLSLYSELNVIYPSSLLPENLFKCMFFNGVYLYPFDSNFDLCTTSVDLNNQWREPGE